MNIHSTFDSGNIELISEQDSVFQLRIREDHHAKYFQWFYFAVSGKAGQRCQFQLINAHQASYVPGWAGYQAVMSYDRKNWQRVPTHYDGKRLIIEHTPTENLAFYAYFVPYSYEAYLSWLAKIQQKCRVDLLTTTADGRMMHLLQIGEDAPGKRKCWLIARQHAGEVMASWYINGFIDRLLDTQDATSRLLLEQAVFYIVPMMNPDGVSRGHLRANAHGLDLNRQWQNPDVKLCPEVFYTRQKMHEVGVDFFLDVHGDETLPYVFLANARDNQSHTNRQTALEDAYIEQLLLYSPEFQTEQGYGKEQFSSSTPTLACNHIAEKFDCLAFTLEMPFKDNQNLPQVRNGWSPERSKKLAHAMLQALLPLLKKLR